MNLRDFLYHYRPMCPLCGAGLQTKFLPSRQCTIVCEDDKLVISTVMKGMRSREPSYKIKYFFGLDDNSFGVDFCDPDNQAALSVPIWKINQFRSFNRNSGLRFFTRECASCCNYWFSSNNFELPPPSTVAKIDLNIGFETYILTDGSRYFKLVNCLGMPISAAYPKLPYSVLQCGNITDNKAENMILPYISFISKEETTRRLATLLPFS